jgi:hypothetical protein
MRACFSSESARHADLRNRIIWCSILAPSTVKGTGGMAAAGIVSGVIYQL